MTSTAPASTVGELLRDWRQRRRLSQLDVSVEADVSTRHLSFVETGRAKPSRELVLHLAEHLDVPLRQRNALLLAAGYAPTYPESPPTPRPWRPSVRRSTPSWAATSRSPPSWSTGGGTSSPPTARPSSS